MNANYWSMMSLILMVFLISCSKPKKNTTEVVEKEPLRLLGEDNQWITEGNASWTFTNGMVSAELDSGGGFIITKERYGNFVLELEFKPDSTINSGVFVRCAKREISADECFEINIWDLHPNQDFRTGAIVQRSKPKAYVETINKWNTYKIECKGDSIKAWVNDILTAAISETKLPDGHVGLQAAGQGSIQFRNISVREI